MSFQSVVHKIFAALAVATWSRSILETSVRNSFELTPKTEDLLWGGIADSRPKHRFANVGNWLVDLSLTDDYVLEQSFADSY